MKAAEETRNADEAKTKDEEDKKRKATAETAIKPAEGSDKQNDVKASGKMQWFYTCEGDRLGPVSFGELREMAEASSLNPRLDMVWKEGMGVWKPAGQIDGLFERRTAPDEPRESLAPSADPYRPPSQTTEADMGKDAGWPGARRRSFLLANLVFPFVWQFGLVAITPFLIGVIGNEIMSVALPFSAIVPLVVAIYFGLNRLVNLGMSRWWYLANFVPILNMWVGYRCFACPAGYAYHKKMDGPGIVLAIFYWLMVLLSILIVIAFVALFFGTIDSPELQEQIREAIRSASKPAEQP